MNEQNEKINAVTDCTVLSRIADDANRNLERVSAVHHRLKSIKGRLHDFEDGQSEESMPAPPSPSTHTGRLSLINVDTANMLDGIERFLSELDEVV